MCLRVDSEAKDKLINSLMKRSRSKRFGYKIVNRINRSPLIRSKYGSKIQYKKGATVHAEPFVYSAESLRDTLKGELGAGGIHVFIKRPTGLDNTSGLLIKVSLEYNDILAAGKDGFGRPCAFVKKVTVLS